ncbi:MAG: hypothetical protein QOE32_6610 [Pseudonocardiales bacterium]|nr:hypothetical protein [Pseudonocardiales bacterium]
MRGDSENGRRRPSSGFARRIPRQRGHGGHRCQWTRAQSGPDVPGGGPCFPGLRLSPYLRRYVPGGAEVWAIFTTDSWANSERRVQRSYDPALVTSLQDIVSGGLSGAQLAVDASDLASATRPMSGPRSRTLSGERVLTGHGGRRDGRGTVILRRTRAPVPSRSRQLTAFDLRVMPLVVVRTSGRAQRRGSAGPSSSGTRRRTGTPRPRAPTTQRARHPRPRGRRSPWSRSRPAT